MRRVLNSLALVAWLLVCSRAGSAQVSSDAQRDLAQTLARLAQQVRQYYDRVSTIICVETVTQQELRLNRTPVGKPRVTVYELGVSRDPKGKGESQFKVERTLLSVNGRRARRDQEPECTDPKTGTPEPLGFLLAENQGRYRFTPSLTASRGPAGTRALAFVQIPPDRVTIHWKGNCFDADGGGQEGQIWFDPETFDVLQVEVRLAKPFLVPPPSGLLGTMPVRVESSEVFMRFAGVKFERPDETVMLPESTEVITVFRGAPSLRTTQVLSNFRRFLAETTIRQAALQGM